MFPSNNLYNTLKLDRLNVRWSKQLACTMYRCIHKLCPPYLTNMFCFRDTIYHTRSGPSKLKLPQPKTNFGKRSLAYRGAKLWNGLDSSASTITSIDVFKRYLNNNPNLINFVEYQP